MMYVIIEVMAFVFNEAEMHRMGVICALMTWMNVMLGFGKLDC